MKQHGFTIIELVTVLIVVGILAVVAFGRLDTHAFAERGLQDRLMAATQFARKAAVASRRYVCVAVAGNRASFTIDSAEPEAVATPFGKSCASITAPLNLPSPDRACGGAANQICADDGMTLTVVGGAAPFQFDPLGRAQAQVVLGTSGGGTVTIEAESGYVH